jgi:hypothetical protein
MTDRFALTHNGLVTVAAFRALTGLNDSSARRCLRALVLSSDAVGEKPEGSKAHVFRAVTATAEAA